MQAVAAELGRRFEGKIADEVYEAMRSNLMNNIRGELQQQGKSWEEFLEENGGEQQVGMMLMLQTREMLVQGFCPRCGVPSREARPHRRGHRGDVPLGQPGMNPKALRQQLEQSGRGFALRESAERMKANKWALEHAVVNVVDPRPRPPTRPRSPGRVADSIS